MTSVARGHGHGPGSVSENGGVVCPELDSEQDGKMKAKYKNFKTRTQEEKEEKERGEEE